MEKVRRIGVARLFCFVLFLGCLFHSVFQKSGVFLHLGSIIFNIHIKLELGRWKKRRKVGREKGSVSCSGNSRVLLGARVCEQVGTRR